MPAQQMVVQAALDNYNDFAIIKLDRKVAGREPLKFRTAGKIADATKLLVIGNPTGLPTKISDGGKVLINSQSNVFVTNLDTFQGNSGSAVFDSTTGQVEGILIQGKTDYVPSISSNPNSCLVVNKCDETGKKCNAPSTYNNPEPAGETVFRIAPIAGKIQEVVKMK
jgi:V8-like Glu-specific endopeptidase